MHPRILAARSADAHQRIRVAAAQIAADLGVEPLATVAAKDPAIRVLLERAAIADLLERIADALISPTIERQAGVEAEVEIEGGEWNDQGEQLEPTVEDEVTRPATADVPFMPLPAQVVAAPVTTPARGKPRG